MDLKEKDIRENIIEDIRPWGNFKRYAFNEKCSVKILTVESGQKLSLQSHKKRDELWIIIDDGLKIELNDKIMFPKPGDEIVILRNTKHRLFSLGKEGRVLEISFGDFNENDIEMFEDIYGRK